MSRTGLVRRAALPVAVIAWSGVLLQCWLAYARPSLGPGGWPGVAAMFGYFTIWSNVLAALVTSRLAWRGFDGSLLGRPGTLAALTVYIVIVGSVYHLVLAAQWHPVGLNLVADRLLHTATPLAVPLLWLALAPHGRLGWRAALGWLAFPAAYLAVALTRGLLAGRWAYPFLDVSQLGGATVSRNIVLLLGVFVVLALGVIALDRWLGRNTGANRALSGE